MGRSNGRLWRIIMDWSQFKNFSQNEFACTFTGQCEMNESFLKKLQSLRELYGKPMRITSGFRHTTHPIEAKKIKAGAWSGKFTYPWEWRKSKRK